MKKLARYLKPFTFMLILAVFLLFGQAMCDLNLPNYMSNIVNVGIQQNGIENASPEAISANGMKFEQTFMTDRAGRLRRLSLSAGRDRRQRPEIRRIFKEISATRR